VRLEQERLGWREAIGTLMQTLGTSMPSGLNGVPVDESLESTAMKYNI
jgi:hypothetical protein